MDMNYTLKVINKGLGVPPIDYGQFSSSSEFGAYCMLLGYEKAKKKYKQKYKEKYKKKYSSNVPKCKSAER